VATLFIADLHLQTEEPAITAGFLRFLRGEAQSADALYILGDLFEAWIGDDDPNPLHREMAAAIKALVDSGVPCFFIHGNRDFLIGKRYARECGMTLLPEEQVLDLYGRKVLIMHGDTLCTDDTGYLAFRAKVHTPWIQTLFLALPLFIRNRIAAKMRAGSKAANSSKTSFCNDTTRFAFFAVQQPERVHQVVVCCFSNLNTRNHMVPPVDYINLVSARFRAIGKTIVACVYIYHSALRDLLI
jgi:UDP-2,3-diacylglucosamine hydrolase